MFQGIFSALPTPFLENGIDWGCFEKLIYDQYQTGIHGIVVTGTTGENPTLSFDEQKDVLAKALEYTVQYNAKNLLTASDKKKTLAGVGSNNTKKTLEMGYIAQTLGYDGLLIVTPYYNKPTQEGLYQHYTYIAQRLEIPILLYDVPGRTSVELMDETVARLCKHDNIVGIKDSTGDLSRIARLKKACGKDFLQLTGEDSILFEYLKKGGQGAISVISNLYPQEVLNIYRYAQKGFFEDGIREMDGLKDIIRLIFKETNPSPIKYALSLKNIMSEVVRLPLVGASDSLKNSIQKRLLNGEKR